MVDTIQKPSFETEICSRCHGSGKYSFCQEYGDRCFKCGGSGKVLTKRGAVASRFFSDSCQITLSEVKPGDRIRIDGITHNAQRTYHYVATVTEVKRSTSECVSSSGGVVTRYYPLTILTQSEKYGQLSLSGPDHTTVRVYRDDDNMRFETALAFQSTLTKNGTVAKRFQAKGDAKC